MIKKSIQEFLQKLFYIGINSVFLAYYGDKKEMEYYQNQESRMDYFFKYKYTIYLKLSQAGSSIIIISIFLTIILKNIQKKLFAYLLYCFSTLGCILIIIGMIIGCLFVLTYETSTQYNMPLAFGFGQIALYLIACINISQIMSDNRFEQIPQSAQQITEQQQIPIGLPIQLNNIQLKQED